MLSAASSKDVLDVINSTLGDGGSSIGDTTRQLIDFIPSHNGSSIATAFSSSTNSTNSTTNSSTTSPASPTSPTSPTYPTEHHNLNELLDNAFQPERQQYIKDLENLAAARNHAVKQSRKCLSVASTNKLKYNRDLPRRALSEHNKVRQTLKKTQTKIHNLEVTNRTLNIELKKYKQQVLANKEQRRRQLNAMKATHKKEVLELTTSRDASKQQCRRLYDSMLTAEVTIRQLQHSKNQPPHHHRKRSG